MKNKATILILAFAFIVFSFSLPTIGTVAYAETEVYLGGIPIGIGLAERGLIVTGTVDVITDEGAICPARGSEILIGDVIMQVNGEDILGVSDFAQKIQMSEGEVSLTVKRGEREMLITLTPVTDILTGLKKLGLTLKNGINGIGTLTFVLPEEQKFGALGHGIVDGDTGKIFNTDSGSIYSCKITGYKRPESGKAGELTGTFTDREHPIGSITRCNSYGVYGIAGERMIEGLSKIKIASRNEVKTGEASIYSTISGEAPKAYKIEIVKTANQKKAAEKSMLIRVTDQELLAATGGILQGMSGSPIVQNGKLVGAVTHVLVNDSTLGYGLYLDWMLENVA